MIPGTLDPAAGIPDSVPVVAGMDSALVQQHYDGTRGRALGDEWGFQGTQFPPLTRTASVGASATGTGKGMEAVCAWLEAQPDKSVRCVPTGCLTNIAVMFTVYPRIMHVCATVVTIGQRVLFGCMPLQLFMHTCKLNPQRKLHSISLMGGAIGVGNMSPAAEFNVLADPEAARIVLGNSREDLPVTVVCILVRFCAFRL